MLSTYYKNSFIDSDGVEYLKDKTILWKAPDNLIEYTVLNDVEEIESDAFSECHNLKRVFLPKSLKSIGDRSFRNCINLETITIPYNVEIIHSLAFENCSSLETVKIANVETKYNYLSFYKCDKLFNIQCLDCVKSKNQGIADIVTKSLNSTHKSFEFNTNELHDIPFSAFRIIRIFCRLDDEVGKYSKIYNNIDNGPIRVYFILDIDETHFNDTYLYIEANTLFNSNFIDVIDIQPRLRLRDLALIQIMNGKIEFCLI